LLSKKSLASNTASYDHERRDGPRAEARDTVYTPTAALHRMVMANASARLQSTAAGSPTRPPLLVSPSPCRSTAPTAACEEHPTGGRPDGRNSDGEREEEEEGKEDDGRWNGTGEMRCPADRSLAEKRRPKRCGAGVLQQRREPTRRPRDDRQPNPAEGGW